MAEENKATARRVIEEFLNTGDPDVADEIFAAGYVDHSPSNPGMSGLENIKRSVNDWHTAFPDTGNTVEDVVAERDKVAVRWATRATHQGEFMGVLPTGTRIAVTGIGVFRFSGGKIVESWDEYDALGLLRQLGASFPPDQAGE
jgi:predicted ester cyclase